MEYNAMSERAYKLNGPLMMTLLFLFALTPLLTVLGYEAYQYFSQNGGTFHWSELGFVWTDLSQSSFSFVTSKLTPDQWTMIEPFLSKPAILMGLGFFVILYVIPRIVVSFIASLRKQPPAPSKTSTLQQANLWRR